MWRVLDEAIDWFVLDEGRYAPLQPDADGVFKSRAFPGLWLDATAMVRGEGLAVLETLQKGIKSAEHAQFVAALQSGGQGVS